MATGGIPNTTQSSKVKTNYARLCRAIIDVGIEILRECLQRHIKPVDIKNRVLGCTNLKLIPPFMVKVNNAHTQGFSKFDISLLYILIRKLCPGISPTRGWIPNLTPAVNEVTEGDDVERIHIIRNNIYGHLPNTCVSDTEYSRYMAVLKDVFLRNDQRYKTSYTDQLSNIANQCMDDVTEAMYLEKMEEFQEQDKILREELEKVSDDVKVTKSRVAAVEDDAEVTKSRVAAVEGEVASVKSTSLSAVTTLYSRIARIEGEVTEVKNNFSSTEAKVTDTIRRLEAVEGDHSHKRAQDILSSSKSMTAAREKALSKSKNAVVSALRNVYFAATNNIANAIVPNLNELCIQQGANQLRDLNVDSHTSYAHNQSVHEFQQSISKVLENSLLAKVRESGCYSVMIDESSDVSVHQNMVVYIRYLDQGVGRVVSQTSFLGIRQLSSAKADSICTELLDVLKSKDLDVRNMVGISTDGASVMVGRKTGVVTRLKAINPGVLSTHCIAHRLALSCGGAADKVSYLVVFQEILNSIYKFFHNSPKNQAKLESIQSVLQSHSTKFKEVFHTRWLSFEGSVQAVVTNFSALVSVFLEENSGRALSLYKPITTYKFLYCAHFLSDVLKQLCYLCKMYQKSDIDFSQVNPLLSSTVSVLEKMRDCKSGPVLGSFLKLVPSEPVVDSSGLCTFEFEGHTVKDSVKQREEAVSACDKFVSNLVENLRDRFTDEGDAKVMAALSLLFDPCVIVADSGIPSDVIDTLSRYLATQGSTCTSVELEGEVIGFKAFCKSFIDSRSLSCVRDIAQFAVKHQLEYTQIGLLGKRLLVLPVSTVDCERGFSRQNLIKTDLRNSLKPKTLENLMRISIEGPPMEQFDFTGAFNEWAKVKSRRILQ